MLSSVKAGKVVDRFVNGSTVATDVKNTFFTGNPEYFRDKMQSLVEEFSMSTDDIKDLSIAALIAKMIGLTKSDGLRTELNRLLALASNVGLAEEKVDTLKLDDAGVAGSDDGKK